MAEQESAGTEQVMQQDLQQEMEQLQGELVESRDRILRAQAELENYRKRSRRELDDERKYASVPLLRDLLPVVDNIDRGLDAAQKAGETGALLDGIKLVKQHLMETLARHNCVEIKADSQAFDPHLHQAITTQPSEQPANTILMVVQPGYQVHDRVIRPSQVIVSRKAE